jgi:hypothetical protein
MFSIYGTLIIAIIPSHIEISTWYQSGIGLDYGYHMFSIYGTLIIVIISSHIEISTWYQSRTGLDSLTRGPRETKTIKCNVL